ncbi:MAG: hypothetical protein ACXAEN_19380 [Candidatus Thorarchaeota archaeon]|jgi:hypothetical protein
MSSDEKATYFIGGLMLALATLILTALLIFGEQKPSIRELNMEQGIRNPGSVMMDEKSAIRFSDIARLYKLSTRVNSAKYTERRKAA